MNALIRVANIEHLQVLEELLFAKVQVLDPKISTVQLPFFNLVNLIVSILTDYSKSKQADQPLSVYFLQYFVKHLVTQLNKHQSPFEVYRHMEGMVSTWRKHLESHEECRVLLSLLTPSRSSVDGAKLFVRIRKAILKNMSSQIMEEMTLTQEDIIAIVHTIFTTEMKNYVTRKLHELFLTLKRKSPYSTLKLNGAVVCEFLMNCSEKFQKQTLTSLDAPATPSPAKTAQPRGRSANTRVTPLALEDSLPIIDAETPIPSINTDHSPERSVSRKKSRASPLKNARDIANSKYSYSWHKFIRTNQELKAKLLGRQGSVA